MTFLCRFTLAAFLVILSGNFALADSRGGFPPGKWEAFGGLPYGCDGEIRAVAIADSGLVYLGGDFQSCENVPANYLVAYDPVNRAFSALSGVNGEGLDGPVRTLALSGDELYAGGEFDHADGLSVGKIARFDGSAWHALGTGISDPHLDNFWVNSIALSDDAVYAAGRFHSAGGVNVKKVARFEEGSWHALGTGIGATADLSEVFTLLVDDDDLLVGGDFNFAGGVEMRCVARWDGSAWHDFESSLVPPGESCGVRTLTAWNGDVYAGGFFDLEGLGSGSNIARWDGVQWNPVRFHVRPQSDHRVEALAVLADSLYVGGHFTEAGGGTGSYISRWDGANWHALDTEGEEGMNLPVLALASADGVLYAGGRFTWVGEMVVHHVVGWDGTQWVPLGQGEDFGVNGRINAVTQIGSDLYFGGQFQTVGGIVAHNVARWDGTQWHALGSGDGNGVQGGFSGPFIDQPARVNALAVQDGDLYVAGTFRRAGGVDANHIARWDGSAWHVLESGVGFSGQYARVFALAVSGNDLYVGGEFTRVSGVEAWYTARWDGSAWHSLGSDILSRGTRAMIVHGGDLYAAGRSDLNNTELAIARWDGSSWGALDGDLLASGSSWTEIHSMAVFDGDLYVSGTFDAAGGVAADRIARWDGDSWHGLGIDFSSESGTDYVRAMSVAGDYLFVGGDFDEAGGAAVGGILAWDGNEWHQLSAGNESGTDGRVNALLTRTRKDCFGSTWIEVLAAGNFSRAGGDVSKNIALYSTADEPDPEQIFCSRFEE